MENKFPQKDMRKVHLKLVKSAKLRKAAGLDKGTFRQDDSTGY